MKYVVSHTEVVKVPAELSNEEVIGACCAFRTVVGAFERLAGIGPDHLAPGTVVWKHLEIIGQCGAEISHYYKVLQIIKNNRQKYPFGDMITSKYTLDRVNEAYASMEVGKDIKPAIVPWVALQARESAVVYIK